MNSTRYFDYIEEKLNLLATRIISRGRLNILNLNIHSENFYQALLNKLYGWNLKNENENNTNVAAIDLIDHDNKYVIQVSATTTKTKVENSLNKQLIESYKHYTFKFVSIAKDADNLKKLDRFNNPYQINFTPQKDVIDQKKILGHVLGLEIHKQREIYNFIKDWFGESENTKLLDSNLAAIINILAKENWRVSKKTKLPFNLGEKIVYNKLIVTKRIINDYKIHHTKINNQYKEFDSSGVNKSMAVLQFFQNCYLKICVEENNPDKTFLNIIEMSIGKVKESANFTRIESDTLALCVEILAVDAFIRCKIFENPEKD